MAVERNKATFIIQIQCKQNATWQGEIVWSEKKETQRFRSELELIKLMESALDREEQAF
ncbi:hypothetical protein CE91St36_20730 [Christensenellaceae bacterium]|nr:hypothetical protein CE91St36_20730 [Christensenellaceae bacterium]BDF61922.1 hypothetical protein CE91St37_20720 [Christensenellaceae bacterium]